jgi:hypothetical protein
MPEPAQITCACHNKETRDGSGGDTSPAVVGAARQKYCYLLSYRYVASRLHDGVNLVHGRILGQANGRLTYVDHAWVVEADGWVWEPINDAWFHDERAFEDSQFVGRPAQRWHAADAVALYGAKEKIGRWDPHQVDG